MAGSPAFIDTNVLVYANQANASRHRDAIELLDRVAAESAALWVSRQVLREYLAVVTRPQSGMPPLPTVVAVERVRYFARVFNVADDGLATSERLLELVTRFPIGGKQVRDANVVATMLTYGVTRLLTFNRADFCRFGTLISIEPA